MLLSGARGFDSSARTGDWQLSTSRSAQGELRQVIAPHVPSEVRLGIGDECGFEASDGTEITCEAGSYCVAVGENAQRQCVEAPRARRFDG
jgi:hypothetical protein